MLFKEISFSVTYCCPDTSYSKINFLQNKILHTAFFKFLNYLYIVKRKTGSGGCQKFTVKKYGTTILGFTDLNETFS